MLPLDNPAMPIFCVCCELTDTTRPLRVLLPAIEQVVAEFGPHLRVAPATWLVETASAVEAVLDKLWPQVLAASERVLVCAVDTRAGAWGVYSGSDTDAASKWIGGRLAE